MLSVAIYVNEIFKKKLLKKALMVERISIDCELIWHTRIATSSKSLTPY